MSDSNTTNISTASTQADRVALFDAVQQQKTGAYSYAYSDLKSGSNAIRSLYYYGLRDTDLQKSQETELSTLSATTSQMISDKNLAERQNEINQWTANNKLDTLFVYQILLMILCATIILVYLMKRGLLSTTVFFIIVGVLALVFLFIIVRRVQYTNILRDKRYWNKRSFEKQNPAPPISLCSS
jgi:hypothetical protein